MCGCAVLERRAQGYRLPNTTALASLSVDVFVAVYHRRLLLLQSFSVQRLRLSISMSAVLWPAVVRA